MLLIDGSKSVRPQNFELVKKFVNQVGYVFIQKTLDMPFFAFKLVVYICAENLSVSEIFRILECIYFQGVKYRG